MAKCGVDAPRETGGRFAAERDPGAAERSASLTNPLVKEFVSMKAFATLAAALLLSAPAQAAWINVDLNEATTGSTILAPGAFFGGSFEGQNVDGGLVDGTPIGPLSIVGSTFDLSVDFYDPGFQASPAANGISPNPRGLSALAILLDRNADAFSFTAGTWAGGSLRARFYAADGTLVATETLSALEGYAMFNFVGIGTFRGVLLDDNQNDGLHFLNFGYNALDDDEPPQVAEPATLALLGMGLLGLAAVRRRKSA
jgi:hypothetical protein